MKSKFNPRQHGFIKSKSTSTNIVAYLDFITPPVHSQRQVGAIYLDLVPHALLLHKLLGFGLAPAYIAWFHSYITHRHSLSTPYVMSSGVPQRSVLGPFVFGVFLNDICSAVQYSDCLVFADDVKIYREIQSRYDCLSLQSDVNNVQVWCISNYM